MKVLNFWKLQADPFGVSLCFRREVLVLEPENPGSEPMDITPKEFGVRTLAHEYGGGAFTVSGDFVFFANYKDQRLYKQSISSLGEQPSTLFSPIPIFQIQNNLVLYY
jgi:hypothetical protein